MGPKYSAGQQNTLKNDRGMLGSIAGAQDLRLKLSSAPHRRTGEGQLRAVLVKHFGEDLGAVNGSRGFERAFREMLWASEASELLLLCHTDPCQWKTLQTVPDGCDRVAARACCIGLGA